MINIYTDGACSDNPGIGGWGVVILIKDEKPILLNGGALNTTNNRMELTAAIEALKYIEKKSEINLFTDSKYVKDGIISWVKKWEINGWKTSNKKPVKNKDLWIELNNQINRHDLNWSWVKGHAGNKYNELADELASKYIKENK